MEIFCFGLYICTTIIFRKIRIGERKFILGLKIDFPGAHGFPFSNNNATTVKCQEGFGNGWVTDVPDGLKKLAIFSLTGYRSSNQRFNCTLCVPLCHLCAPLC
ncbi:MAG TPA: hypothetical protein DEG17_23575 [Cyanobacteria bacterium UBA11149]|nr:hypothetical protein [Cyanobacteria bacterium UBA11367]HBR73069.1 hypothetical protein [Cyanobacteria bacterium UBA11159]HBS70123.1 hypothetical protein [Cyanobacteria bacterium UBA11153]HBW91763.1 hypothetical protein [Cyanobacteria bacterium UBA11149]HCA95575.1 hypothetical protein [Cyanobacteria bacterium UBA9226]